MYKTIFLMVMLFCPVFCFGEIRIRVVDQHNMPVDNAVISVKADVDHVPANKVVIDQVGKQFVPKTSAIHKGQYVSFPNSDNTRHHVYSFSKPKVFEIRLYSGSPSEPILFDQPGIVILGCNIHDNMVGYIYVADNEIYGLSDKKGEVRLHAPVTDSFFVWHPNMLSGDHQRQRMTGIELSETGEGVVQIELKSPTELPKRHFGSKFN